MRLKTKLFASLFVVLMLGMATSAFADLNCAVTTTPVPREVLNSHWANTGDLTFTCTAPNATATTEASITVFYSGLTITNTTATNLVPVGALSHEIRVLNGAVSPNAFIDTTRSDNGLGSTGVSNTGSLVAITIPVMTNPQTACPTPCSFTLLNVVLSLAGSTTAGQPIAANINLVSQSGNTTLTGSPIVIISQVLPFLNSTTNPPALVSGTNPATFTATGANPPPSATCPDLTCQNNRARFRVTVSEDHIDSWRTTQQYYNNAIGLPLNGTNILFTFSGMLPGSIITNCVLTSPAGTTWTLTGAGIANSTGQATLVAELGTPTVFSGPTNLNLVETLELACGTGTGTTAYNPGASSGPASTPITVSMSAYPTGNALNGNPLSASATGGVPRYATGSAVGPITVINFVGGVSGQTTMLIPYVTASGAAAPPAGTFNTGVTVANTTEDPLVFGTDAQGGAVDTAGNITFYFFPADATAANFAVTPTTGFGLQNGVLPAGGTFIGLFSDILKLGSVTGPFQGYVFIVANFTHAHGSAFVFGGTAADRLTSAQSVLTLGNPTTNSRNLSFGGLPNVEVTSH